MKVVFFGATRGMGRALSRRMAQRGDRIFLLGRNADDLQRSATDLTHHGAEGSVSFALCDLLRPEGFSAAFTRAEDALEGFDTVVLTAGLFATQDQLESDAGLRDRLLQADFAHSIAFCEEARRRLMARGGGTLCAFSSVAGERGRKPVVLYGAAKAGLSHYLEGLDHRYRADGLRTVCVKPGFVRTAMTADLDPPPFAGEPDDVARVVLRALDRGKPVVYVPAAWRWIMALIRMLPRQVMRRVGF